MYRRLRPVLHLLGACLAASCASWAAAQPIAAPSDARTPANQAAPFKLAPGGGALANPGVLSKLAEVEADPPVTTRGDPAGLERVFEARCRSVVFIVAAQGEGKEQKIGTGTGAIVTQDGHVLTAAHVIAGADEVGVGVFPDCKPGTKPDLYKASVFRVDEVADLALLKLDTRPRNMSIMPLGSLSPVRTGSQVVIIGHPRGLLMSMSTGIVSAVRPNFTFSPKDSPPQRATVIQTDGALNPGNSGGPMMTPRGDLIGVNSFILGNASAGLNFAVSVNDVRAMLTRNSDRMAQRATPAVAPSAAEPPPAKETKACEPKVLKEWDDAGAKKRSLDIGCTGKANAILIVPGPGGGKPTLQVDRNGDGRGDVIYYLNAEGNPEASEWDDDYDGTVDFRSEHANGNWQPQSKTRVAGK